MVYEALRWISLAEALLLIGWAMAVMQEARRFRPPNLYVRLVAASYVLLVVAAAIHAAFSHTNAREPHLLIWLRVVALSYGLGAMVFMWRYYRLPERERRHQRRAEEEAARLRREAGV